MNGSEYLTAARHAQDRCAVATDMTAPTLHPHIPDMLKMLGEALLALEQFGTCSWGCQGPPHVMERFAARTVSYSLAILRLLWFGHYDEALALVRNIGELANLLLLFADDVREFERWKAANETVRRNEFGAGAVRQRLAQRDVPVALGRDHFNELSSRYSHSGQDPTPQMHNVVGVPTMGSRVQPEALRWGLLQLGIFVAIIATTITEIAELSDDRRALLERTGADLGDAASKLQPM